MTTLELETYHEGIGSSIRWRCTRCGAWVPVGEPHTCPGFKCTASNVRWVLKGATGDTNANT